MDICVTKLVFMTNNTHLKSVISIDLSNYTALVIVLRFFFFFFFKQKTAYEIRLSLVGSEMCKNSSYP